MRFLKNPFRLAAPAACLFGALFCASLAFAQENTIRQRFKERVLQGESVTSVKKTPWPGMYEVRVGNRIVYTDSRARYLFIGRMIDIETGQDYTRDRIEAISRIRFSDLPLDQAIRKVNGRGERKVAVFSDPNCGYCKRLEKLLKNVDNLTVYVFPLNILSEQSRTLSRNIWCAPNPAEAWNAWMLEGQTPPEAPKECAYTGEAVLGLARQFEITGTPVIFFQDGSRITGLPDADDFSRALSAAK
ncbi:MAG: DsbC family protein [Oxalobacter formigenes]|nr:DsbC family protein [Oxalobacter formigenes]